MENLPETLDIGFNELKDLFKMRRGLKLLSEELEKEIKELEASITPQSPDILNRIHSLEKTQKINHLSRIKDILGETEN